MDVNESAAPEKTVSSMAAAAVDAEESAPGAVDLEAMLNAFIADDSSESLELPSSLTADQRKQAKRLADQHPKLKCESYGFGDERRLHLFKKDKDRVRVKNTFIDGWDEGGDSAGDAHAMFKSMPDMPVALLERTLQRAMRMEGTTDAPVVTPQKDATATSSGAGSPADRTTCPDASPTGHSSGASSAPELPPLPDELKVRNTFIHIESVKDVDRIVQSMPHGMFRQCLQAELSKQAELAAQAAPAAASAAPPAPVPPVLSTGSPAKLPAFPADDSWLAPGTEVIIQGLIKLPDFNGLRGVVQSLDENSGRYDILLEDPAGQCGWRWVKVKSDNCRPCMPPPPSSAPTISNAVDGASPKPKGGDATRANEVPGQGGSATPLKLNALV